MSLSGCSFVSGLGSQTVRWGGDGFVLFRVRTLSRTLKGEVSPSSLANSRTCLVGRQLSGDVNELPEGGPTHHVSMHTQTEDGWMDGSIYPSSLPTLRSHVQHTNAPTHLPGVERGDARLGGVEGRGDDEEAAEDEPPLPGRQRGGGRRACLVGCFPLWGVGWRRGVV